MVELKEIRNFLRDRAKELGLPGTGRCYNDKRKKGRSVKIGLVAGGVGRRVSETHDQDRKILEQIAKEAFAKFGIEMRATEISKGCRCCAGFDLGIYFDLPL